MTDLNNKTKAQKILEIKCARLASLMDLFGENKIIQEDPTLAGAFAAIKGLYVETWEELEAACE